MIQSIVWIGVMKAARQARCRPKNGSELTHSGTRRRRDRRSGFGALGGGRSHRANGWFLSGDA